ncbi:hypothetical protein OsI_02360 [Oryza sativa Indica Group]|uniref:Uncharacterized protein n=1 Tax=Oryza sativa subsp. indica TaxID=39946 RepID=A2WR74_ORYSI|nr:hypothetical protein OsI_02360 [Oryza sativa Indica Group]
MAMVFCGRRSGSASPLPSPLPSLPRSRSWRVEGKTKGGGARRTMAAAVPRGGRQRQRREDDGGGAGWNGRRAGREPGRVGKG